MKWFKRRLVTAKHFLVFRISFPVLIVSLFDDFMVFVVKTMDIFAHVQSTK